ncbi:MAG: cytochrome C [Syntrophales bacterium]
MNNTISGSSLIVVLWLWLAGAIPVYAAPAMTTDELNRRCLSCHDDFNYRVRFFESLHRNNGCVSCHSGIRDFARHASGEERLAAVACGNCHGEIAGDYLKDVHYLRQDFRCNDCHRDIHGLRRPETGFKVSVVNLCTKCHSSEEYVRFGHGKYVLEGKADSAACSDCHGLHNIPLFPPAVGKSSPEARVWYTDKCIRCHGNEAMMKRNGLSAATVRDYEETYHGKVRKIGYAGQVAGCADCHTSHNILPAADPRSAVNPENLIATCGKCHHGFQPRFVEFNAHPDYRNRERYPVLFWTYVFMAALLASVFCFFWIHLVLWWRKAYWEKCRRLREGKEAPECEEEQIERFSLKERVMHIVLIFSFFTLVMTGIPLKYHNSDWSKILIQLFGGVPRAGVFHRAAALVLTALFLYTCWLSLRFLFPAGRRMRGWISRLFGPDSLFPNLKDLRDIKGMFLWFFDRGEMPRFDRWTYWEKFDFFAVFWGMAAIGGSGLILWFPEFFSYIFPGWVINAATIVHSEEALLAALFIFTVHFFNNHLVPNKFPLEPNIFTGRNGLRQLQAERPLEYERLMAENRLESLKRPRLGVATRLLSSLFGLASLLLGLFLVFLILWTILSDTANTPRGGGKDPLTPPGSLVEPPQPQYKPVEPPVPAPPALPWAGHNRGAVNPRTGEYYPPSGKGVINPRTGEYYPPSGQGFINPRTGAYYPRFDPGGAQ